MSEIAQLSFKVEHTAWLIESQNISSPQTVYFAGIDDAGFLIWTFEHLKAVRFSRKEDAEKIRITNTAGEVRIAEHAWN